VLIVSGVEQRRSVGDSWYRRLEAATPVEAEAADALPPEAAALEGGEHGYRDFRPPKMPAGVRRPIVDTDAIRLGVAWHALMQQAAEAAGDRTPAFEQGLDPAPDPAHIARAHRLSPEAAAAAIDAARRVLQSPPLQALFSGGSSGFNELELVDDDGATMRIDRVVEVGGEVWVVDYKWRLSEDQRADHEGQLRRYKAALQRAGVSKPLRLLLIGADASAIEVLDRNRGTPEQQSFPFFEP
jgi:hypothetical protein